MSSRALNAEDLANALPEMETPILLLVGTDDKDYAGMMSAALVLPSAKLVALPGLDHAQTFFRVNDVLPHITEFLDEVRQE